MVHGKPPRLDPAQRRRAQQSGAAADRSGRDTKACAPWVAGAKSCGVSPKARAVLSNVRLATLECEAGTVSAGCRAGRQTLDRSPAFPLYSVSNGIPDMPRGRKPIGDHALSGAERQARFMARLRAPQPAPTIAGASCRVGPDYGAGITRLRN